MRKNKCELLGLFNYSSHYRGKLYSAMLADPGVSIVAGGNWLGGIKKADITQLPSDQMSELKNAFAFKGRVYWQFGLIRQLLRYKPKVVLMTGDLRCISYWWVLIVAKFVGIKVVLWTHGYYGRESRINLTIKRLFYSLAEQILTYNQYSKGLLVEGGFKAENINVFNNSLLTRADIDELQKNKPAHVKSETIRFIYVARIFRGRKIEVLFRACNKIASQVKIKIVLVGPVDDDYREELSKIPSSELTVDFYGPCYDKVELQNLYSQSDLAISPGSVGLFAIQAQQFGLPMISHDDFSSQGPEFESVIPGVTGDFFKFDSENDLSEVILKWVNKIKTEGHKEIADKCTDNIRENYTVDYQIKIFKRIKNHFCKK